MELELVALWRERRRSSWSIGGMRRGEARDERAGNKVKGDLGLCGG